ncbi:dihydrofolate reductase family protein [Flavitalea flava]
MRKIIFQTMVTLDGYFKGPDHDISWHIANESNQGKKSPDPKEGADEVVEGYTEDFLSTVDTFLFGRVTYELMASYWPSDFALKDDPATAKVMNTTPKVVFSRTLDTVGWQNSRLEKGHIGQEISRLKEQPGKNIAIFGSSNLAMSLIPFKLIDEFRIIISPIALGRGTPLFHGIENRLNLNLVKSTLLPGGRIMHTYVPVED